MSRRVLLTMMMTMNMMKAEIQTMYDCGIARYDGRNVSGSCTRRVRTKAVASCDDSMSHHACCEGTGDRAVNRGGH